MAANRLILTPSLGYILFSDGEQSIAFVSKIGGREMVRHLLVEQRITSLEATAFTISITASTLPEVELVSTPWDIEDAVIYPQKVHDLILNDGSDKKLTHPGSRARN